MQDYEAIDISDHCNTGAAILGDLAEDVETGQAFFRGLPFLISEANENCWIAPDKNVTIAIGEKARNVIVAHAMLESLSLIHISEPTRPY